MNKFVNVLLQVLPNMPENFPKDIGHSSELDLEKNCVLAHEPDGLWIKVTDEMLIKFAESGHLLL